MNYMDSFEWLLCPVCNSKTRIKLRLDTELKNFPLFCPKCKQETLISVHLLARFTSYVNVKMGNPSQFDVYVDRERKGNTFDIEHILPDDYSSYQDEFVDADDKFTRNAPLVGDDTISKQDYETLLNTKNKSAADLKAAVAQKNYAQNQLNYTKLYAPDDGIIMVRVQEPGATVAKGQAVYTMAKTKPVWVRAYVNETDLGNIKYGQQVSVYTDTIDPATGKKREYKGQIGYISPVAEFTPKTVQSTDTRTNLVYRMRVYIYDIDEFLRQGMPVTINVDLTKGKAKKR